jgi:hypothetical protein
VVPQQHKHGEEKRMRILAIDPGNIQSAYVVLEHTTMKVEAYGLDPNTQMLLGFQGDRETFYHNYYDVLCIEFPVPRGMPASKELFDTIYWIGRFDQAGRSKMVRVDRKEVKMVLCGSTRAKDSNITAAIKDRFLPYIKPGSKSKKPVIGCAGSEGPLYGIKKDMWAALGVALTYMDSLGKESHSGYAEYPPRRKTPRSYSKEFDEMLK